MNIVQILTDARALVTTKLARGTFARDAQDLPVHALSPGAVAWDAAGALHKVVGDCDSDQYQYALKCLAVGAMRVTGPRIMGVSELSDHGHPAQIDSMFRFAIAAAEQVTAPVVAPVAA